MAGQPTKRPTFFIKRGDRLIARLKHAFYAWRFANQVNGRVIVIWTPVPAFWSKYDGTDTDYSPSRIFNLREFYAAGGGDDFLFLEGAVPYPLPAERRSVRDAEFASMRPNGFGRDYFHREAPIFYEQDALVFSFKDEPRTKEYTQRSLRELYDRLPHDPLVARTVNWGKDRLGSDYVALHVRRGDVVEMLRTELPKLVDNSIHPDRLALLMGHYVCRTALNEFYYSEIEKTIKSGRKIAYFSDSPETLAHFIEKFGRRHFFDGERLRGRYPIQKAFIDFNLIIDASKIISTGSNYASFAATLGGAEMVNVAVAGGLDLMEQHLYEEYLVNTELPASGKKMLRDELERQYNRRSRMRPLEADEALADGPPPELERPQDALPQV